MYHYSARIRLRGPLRNPRPTSFSIARLWNDVAYVERQHVTGGQLNDGNENIMEQSRTICTNFVYNHQSGVWVCLKIGYTPKMLSKSSNTRETDHSPTILWVSTSSNENNRWAGLALNLTMIYPIWLSTLANHFLHHAAKWQEKESESYGCVLHSKSAII